MFRILLSLIFMAIASTAASAAERVTLEIVLAVDSSASVDQDEFDLQMKGLAAAFRNPDVVRAIQGAGPGGVAVGLVEWACQDMQRMVVDWTVIRDAASAAALAARIENTERLVLGHCTAIGNLMAEAARLLHENQFVGDRQVIDVSGDGPVNQGLEPQVTRDAVVESGVTVNGLAILSPYHHDLDAYYRTHVVGGPGSFLLVADGYPDFARAIRLKLIREIRGVAVAASE